MDVQIHNKQILLELEPHLVQQIVCCVLSTESICTDEVAIHFVETSTICELHKEYFDDPTPTDCITFPIDSPSEQLDYHVLGEVFVCPETALTYGKNHAKDPYEETTLYIVHGLLHLIGYDDRTSEDQKEMRKAENRLMNLLKKQKIGLKIKGNR